MGSRRIAGLTAVVAGPIAITSSLVILAAVDWDAEIFSDATRLLDYGPGIADAARTAMVLDVLGYYLLAIPAVIFLHRAWIGRAPDTARIAGLAASGYTVGGAAGAAVLSAAWPAALEWSGEPGAEIAAHVLVTEAVTKGVWNLMGSALFAVWFFLLADAIWSRARGLAYLTYVLATASALDAVLTALGASDAAAVALQVYLYGWPVWVTWLGVILLRGGQPILPASSDVVAAEVVHA